MVAAGDVPDTSTVVLPPISRQTSNATEFISNGSAGVSGMGLADGDLCCKVWKT